MTHMPATHLWDRAKRQRVHVPVTCIPSSLSHLDACIVGLSHQYHTPAGQGLVMIDFEEYVGPDASHAIWQTIAHHLGGQNLPSIRAVCRTSRKAVDDAVTAIAVPIDAVQGFVPMTLSATSSIPSPHSTFSSILEFATQTSGCMHYFLPSQISLSDRDLQSFALWEFQPNMTSQTSQHAAFPWFSQKRMLGFA